MVKNKVFAATFDRHYPVGTGATVIAPDVLAAELLLRNWLREHHGLSGAGIALTELPVDMPKVHVSADGDY